MKKILMVCNFFAPENEIAAIRLTKLAKYLKRAGYEVEVLTEQKTLGVIDSILQEDAIGIPVTKVDISEWVKKIDAWYNRITKMYREKQYNDLSSRMQYDKKVKMEVFYPFEKLHPFVGTMDALVRLFKDYNLSRNARRYLKNISKDLDVCFSSYGRYFGHFVGNYVKKQNVGIHWIADFRDPVYQVLFTPKFFVPIAEFYDRWVYKKADNIVVVSQGMAIRFSEKYKDKIHCITNGYDQEDKRYCINTKKIEKFVITYTGRMYGGLYDVSKIFQIVRELIDISKIDENNLEFHYAGTGFEVFLSKAKEYQLHHLCVNYGMVNREKALQIQAESSLLVMATWDYQYQTIGHLTGKVLEYMMHEKPIIALISGDIKNHELTKMIRKSRIGEVYEETNSEQDIIRVKDYIEKQYSNYCEGKKLGEDRKQELLEKYEYQNITNNLIQLIENRK